MTKNYNDLEIFHLAYDFVITLYPLIDKFPDSEHKNLVLQMKRAAVSMPMNIAEGASRKTDKQFLPFLSYAYGSAKELEVCLNLSKDFGFLDEKSFNDLWKRLDKFGGKIVGLMRYLEKNVQKKKDVYVAKVSRGENPWKEFK